jgi:phage terminase Nu1 subunit (DNA packaging protein)
MTMDLTKAVTQQDFGKLVGITQQAVSELIARGVLTPDEPVAVWLVEYCGNLRETAAGRLGSGDLDLVSERARLASEQADKIAMQNAVSRKELAPITLIEEVLSKAGARVAGILDGLPGAIKRRAPSLTHADIQMVAGEIARARNIAAAISLRDLEVEPEAADEGGFADEVLQG